MNLQLHYIAVQDSWTHFSQCAAGVAANIDDLVVAYNDFFDLQLLVALRFFMLYALALVSSAGQACGDADVAVAVAIAIAAGGHWIVSSCLLCCRRQQQQQQQQQLQQQQQQQKQLLFVCCVWHAATTWPLVAAVSCYYGCWWQVEIIFVCVKIFCGRIATF